MDLEGTTLLLEPPLPNIRKRCTIELAIVGLSGGAGCASSVDIPSPRFASSELLLACLSLDVF